VTLDRILVKLVRRSMSLGVFPDGRTGLSSLLYLLLESSLLDPLLESLSLDPVESPLLNLY
jgi:hypothetical protein